MRAGGAARLWPAALAFAALLGAWQLAASTGSLADALGLEPFLIPSPAEIGESLWTDRGLLADNAWVTLREVLAGFAVAVLLGVATAVALHLSPLLRRVSYPLVIASQTIPVIVIAPILVVWFGFGIGPKIAIIALICFFPITVNTLDGLATVPVEQRRLMRSLGASRLRLLTLVEGPTALPFALSGAKVAAAVAVIGAVFGEWAGANDGLGHLMLVDNAQLEVARLFAAIVWLSAIAIALFACLGLIGRRIAWWGEPAETGGKPGEE
jgi:NitT/TauT family transport system permease protein/putative hydroxymethylpyrimidine transport system permease protein